MGKTRVLIVDDSRYMQTIIKDALENADYQVIGSASNGEEAIDLALELQPDVITLDNILPDMLGIDVLRTLKQQALPSEIILISAVGQQSVIDDAMDLGAKAYITKPFTTNELINKFKKLGI